MCIDVLCTLCVVGSERVRSPQRLWMRCLCVIIICRRVKAKPQFRTRRNFDRSGGLFFVTVSYDDRRPWSHEDIPGGCGKIDQKRPRTTSERVVDK